MSQEHEGHEEIQDEVLGSIIEAVRCLEFGEVHITIHDSQVVRIEKIERIRFGVRSARPASAGLGQGGKDL